MSSEIKSNTGNVSYDRRVASTYGKLRAALQLEVINDRNPLETVRREHEAIIKTVHDPEQFFQKYSLILTPQDTPDLSRFLYITSHLEGGLEEDVLREYKQELNIAASAKALLFYFYYVDAIREGLEADPHPANLSAVIDAPTPTAEIANKTFQTIQPYREAFLDFLIAGLKLSASLHLNRPELYQREILEFSRLSAADQDNNPFTYLKERLKTEDPQQRIHVDTLYSTCQEITRAGYAGILMSFRTRRYKYLAMALAVDDYLRYLHSLTGTRQIINDEDSDPVALIKLTKKYTFKKKISALFTQLTEKGFLECNEQDFLGLFGKQDKDSSPKKIVWKASQASLFYFLFRLLKEFTEMDTMKIFVRVADEWFVKVEQGKKISFSNAIHYHSALDRFLQDRKGNYESSKSYLPSKDHVQTLDMILKTSMYS
jgi:hypothetical protein